MLAGCDFSSSPSRRKPIVVAEGAERAGRVTLARLHRFETLDAWSGWLCSGPWVCGFDFPFGLPRELVTTLGWPLEWRACMAHYGALPRDEVRARFAAFCDARPTGAKFAHRATDAPAGSSPSMNWVNPPVALMLHAGVPRLIAAGAHVPGLAEGDRSRVALEAYPGQLARELIGRRSYKSDAAAGRTPERLIARKDLLAALEAGRTRLALRLALTAAQHDSLVADASGDSLDAVLCLVQAAWAARENEKLTPAASGNVAPGWGLPADMDPLEGWIIATPQRA